MNYKHITINERCCIANFLGLGWSIRKIANMIATSTNADTFKLEPKDVYTDENLDWSNSDSRVNKEHDDESQRNIELVSITVKDWDSYDTVFIGYPIWWGIDAWPVNGFVEKNDFSGKKVIPFCTSSSSGIGDSGNLLSKMAGTGDWKEDQRFSSSDTKSNVESWLKELGFN